MSGIAGIFNVPTTPDELSTWASVHARHHQDILNYIYRTGGISLDQYVLEPINPANTAVWDYQHQIMHQQMDAILSISGYDLTGVNFNNKEDLAAWIRLNATEHYEADAVLRISVPVIPVQSVVSTFRDRAEQTSTVSTRTFLGIGFGPASSARYLVAAFSWQTSGGATLSSATIGGIAATILIQLGPVTGGRCAALVIAAVPLGTSGAVVANFTTGTLNGAVALYSLIGIGSAAASVVASANATNPGVSLPVAANGTVIGVATGGSAVPPSATWTGLTEDCDNNYGTGNLQCRSSASKNFTQAQASLPVQCTFSTSTGSAGCFAVFNP